MNWGDGLEQWQEDLRHWGQGHHRPDEGDGHRDGRRPICGPIDALEVTVRRAYAFHDTDGVAILSDTPTTFDLVQLQNGARAQLALATFSPGEVRHMALVISHASVVVAGERRQLWIPPDRRTVWLSAGMPVFPGSAVEVDVAFDVGRSLQRRGRWRIFLPEVHLEIAPDEQGPHIVVLRPELRPHPTIADYGVVRRQVEEGLDLTIQGRASDVSGIADVAITINGTPVAVGVDATGRFTASGLLDATGPGPVVETTVIITARDHLGLTAQRGFIVELVKSVVLPGLVSVRFHPNASQLDISDFLAEQRVRVVHQYPPTRQYLVAVGATTDTQNLARTYSADPRVAFAAPELLGEDSGTCSSGDLDPSLATPGQYYMENSGDYVLLDHEYDEGRPCREGQAAVDCANPGDECITGACTLGDSPPAQHNALFDPGDLLCPTEISCATPGRCTTRNHCAYGRGDLTTTECDEDSQCALQLGDDTAVCVLNTGLCGKRGGDGYDIGWVDASAQVCGGEEGIVVAIAEHVGLVNLLHSDLQTRVWTNFLECRGKECDTDEDCIDAGMPVGSSCQGRLCDGTDSDLLPDCRAGQASPGDGCPGLCGDDDLDGKADFDDPEVKLLVQRLLSNCKDDDDDSIVDDGRPSVDAVDAGEVTCGNCVDDDADGVVDDGCPAIVAVGDPEDVLAQEDDDENGYIDDIHGYDFYSAFINGERHGSTHPVEAEPYTRDYRPHATLVASSIAAQIDNAIGLAGTSPHVRIMTLATGSTLFYVDAMDYARRNGARIVNLSWQALCRCANNPCVDDDLDAYQTCILSNSHRFADASSTSMLYVKAAGNGREDLTVDPIPGSGGSCGPEASDRCVWRFPQNVGTYLDLSGVEISGGTGSIHGVVVASSNIRDQLVDFQTGRASSGSNVGQVLDGGSPVDFAAPSDVVDLLSNGPTDVVRGHGETSFAAAMVSGVASVLVSVEPELFDGKPTKIVERLVQTLRPCQDVDNDGLRDCDGNMLTPGIVDLQDAIDFDAIPVPPSKLYEAETWRLNDEQRYNTTDLDLIDADGDGDVDFLFEIYGGPFVDEAQPRLFVLDLALFQFHDRTFGNDNAPGGTDLDEDRLPRFPGNYNKADFADLDNDGCTDLVVAGFLQQDPAPSASPGDLAGRPNHLLLQATALDGTCKGVFVDSAGDEVGPGSTPRMPTRSDMTRDVDAFDVDGDGDIDIFFANATFSLPGGDLGDQLLINRLVPEGVAYFVDESASRLMPATTADVHRSSVDACDLDADGDLDIVQAAYAFSPLGNPLWINDGHGVFQEVGIERGLPPGTDFSHDVECHDFTGDGYPDLVFARRNDLSTLYLVNQGAANPGYFTDQTGVLMPATLDTTQEIEVCDLDGDGVSELLVGNGDIMQYLSQENRVVTYDPASGQFSDVLDPETQFGLDFNNTVDLTEDIECPDVDGDGRVDLVLSGNTGQHNELYRRQ
jgi:hypothetical protein